MMYSHHGIKGLGGFENVQVKVGLFNISWEEPTTIYQIRSEITWEIGLIIHFYRAYDLFQKYRCKNRIYS